MRCRSANARLGLTEAGEVVRQLGAPRRPVVRELGSPDVELVAQTLVAELPRERLGADARARRVLPLAAPDDEQDAEPRPQPVEVVAVQLRDVVRRVVEVDGVATLAP